MELRDVESLASRARSLGDGARMLALHPVGRGDGLMALDLLEVEPGAASPAMQTAEEHLLYVLSGTGEVRGGTGGPAALVRAGSIIHIDPREAHTLAATGRESLRVLVVTPLVVLSDRALGLSIDVSTLPTQQGTADQSIERDNPAERSLRIEEREPDVARPTAVQPAQSDTLEEPRPDISGLVRKASELTGQPRPERKRPDPMPEPQPQTEPTPESQVEGDDDAEEEASNLLELLVVFDGGSRGNPGQGYGSYLVQSPGRKPIVKRVEFGDKYTNNQAEYDSLIASLEYIIERLSATGRSPEGVGLDIKGDSDLVVNQLQGNYKVKEANLKPRHAKAMALLDRFGAWVIDWHPREESVRLLGH